MIMCHSGLFSLSAVQSLESLLEHAKGRVLSTRTEELNRIQSIFGRRLVLFHRCSFLVKADSKELNPACGVSRY